MVSIQFLPCGWDDYLRWQDLDRKMMKRINRIIMDMQRHPFEGIGKPEGLKGDLSGWWSRRIDLENRIVYRVEQDTIIILECATHYEK